MLIPKQNTCFLLIDVQEKLTPHVIEHDALVDKCAWLLKLAKEFNIPSVISEQYPKGLGPTVASLKEIDQSIVCFDKVYFSAGKDEQILNHLQSKAYQTVILFGIEAHVCVMQSAIDLKAAGFNVFVVADAISSREQQSIYLGLQRMRSHGVEVVNAEMVFFELIEKAGTPEFKALSKAFLQ